MCATTSRNHSDRFAQPASTAVNGSNSQQIALASQVLSVDNRDVTTDTKLADLLLRDQGTALLAGELIMFFEPFAGQSWVGWATWCGDSPRAPVDVIATN